MALFGSSTAKAAYSVVDITKFPADVQEALVADAANGATLYGLRVVEEYINGPARSAVYGVYNGGEDEGKWKAALAEIGESADDADEEAIRLAAEEKAAADAAEATERQERSVRAVTEKEGDGKKK